MRAAAITVLLVAIAVTAGAETITKWRTPDGRLHLGDNPPAGSELIETVTFPDREARPTEETAAEDEAREEAAAHGREIIRRRVDERRAREEEAAERRGRAETAYYEELPSTVIVLDSGIPYGMRDRFDPVYGFYRPRPPFLRPPHPPPPPPSKFHLPSKPGGSFRHTKPLGKPTGSARKSHFSRSP